MSGRGSHIGKVTWGSTRMYLIGGGGAGAMNCTQPQKSSSAAHQIVCCTHPQRGWRERSTCMTQPLSSKQWTQRLPAVRGQQSDCRFDTAPCFQACPSAHHDLLGVHHLQSTRIRLRQLLEVMSVQHHVSPVPASRCGPLTNTCKLSNT